MLQIQIGIDEVLAIEKKGSQQAYQEFADKFKPKKTTDDCYTPQIVFDAVAEWVSQEYGRDKAGFVRPFWPGGDYEAQEYPDGCTVVDNPPFSILARIIRFYHARGIQFFLFAPALTLFSARDTDVSYLAAGCDITYANGAEVKTSFITSLDTCRVRTCPELWRRVKAANEANLGQSKTILPKYDYPDEIITAAMVQRWTQYGVDWRLEKDACVRVSALDAQRAVGKAIFGGGYMMSERAAKDKVKAEQEANSNMIKRSMAAAGAAEERTAAANASALKWELSEGERWIISRLK